MKRLINNIKWYFRNYVISIVYEILLPISVWIMLLVLLFLVYKVFTG